MTPGNRDILFAGEWHARTEASGVINGTLKAEGAHLTCFVGGMYALGAKIFDRPKDLDIAAKLTEGCVWAYSSTTTGIMPEIFEVVACKDKDECEWDDEVYYSALDPHEATRTKLIEPARVRATTLATETKELLHADDTLLHDPAEAPPQPPSIPDPRLDKRDVLSPEVKAEHAGRAGNAQGIKDTDTFSPAHVLPPAPPAIPAPAPVPTTEPSAPASTPRPPLPHKAYAQARIVDERLPPGMTRIQARKYILRPEAIESVWYMYRITGDAHWRTVGWDMFLAVTGHTRTKYGHSAIDDVTKASPGLLDQEESFWMAETLKVSVILTWS